MKTNFKSETIIQFLIKEGNFVLKSTFGNASVSHDKDLEIDKKSLEYCDNSGIAITLGVLVPIILAFVIGGVVIYTKKKKNKGKPETTKGQKPSLSLYYGNENYNYYNNMGAGEYVK